MSTPTYESTGNRIFVSADVGTTFGLLYPSLRIGGFDAGHAQAQQRELTPCSSVERAAVLALIPLSDGFDDRRIIKTIRATARPQTRIEPVPTQASEAVPRTGDQYCARTARQGPASQ
jgi:hypothetical protein